MQKDNILVAQSGGPSCAINASLVGLIKKAYRSNLKIIGSMHGIEGILAEDFVDLSDLSGDELELLKTTPSMALGSCRYKIPSDDKKIYQDIVNIFIKHDIKYFFYIGGNDSMDTVKKISEYISSINFDISVIGIPKTIDNDLMCTDHTPGFGSAAKYIITTMNELIRDLSIYNMTSITIVETMGRNTGWLTLAAGVPLFLGKNKPDLIYIPEVVFDEKEFLLSLSEKLKSSKNIIVVVSEGLKDIHGDYIGQSSKLKQKDNFGHLYLSGVSKYLERLVKSNLGVKVRSVELNLMQRCAGHIASKTDLDESERIGGRALNYALNNHTGITVIYHRISSDPYEVGISTTDVSNIANLEKKVPNEWFNLYDPKVQKEIVDYILPLTQGSPKQYLDENGFHKYYTVKRNL